MSSEIYCSIKIFNLNSGQTLRSETPKSIYLGDQCDFGTKQARKKAKYTYPRLKLTSGWVRTTDMGSRHGELKASYVVLWLERKLKSSASFLSDGT